MEDIDSGSAINASDVLIEHWKKGTTLDNLPEPIRPSTIASGYNVQQYIERLTTKPLFGWKIAATSVHGQQHINVDRPLAGRILAERVTKLGQPVSLGPNRMQVAELEFVFRVGKSLGPRPEPYEVEEVISAVDALFLGVEVPDSRFTNFTAVGAAQLIADNAAADKFVLGPEVEVDWRSKDLPAHKVRGWKSDGEVHEGSGAAVLTDPRIAMTWIANELSRHNVTLKQGEYVTTGTCIVPLPVRPGDTIHGDYGEFGKVQVDFVE